MTDLTNNSKVYRGTIMLCVLAVGMFGFAFHPGPIRNFKDAQRAHPGRFRRFFDSMLESGIYLAPSAFEAGFVSLAHRSSDLRGTLKAAEIALQKAARIR